MADQHPPSSSAEEEPPTVAVPLDSQTKATVQAIPLLSVRAGPRDGADWIARLKQELNSLISYVNHNKKADNDWFIIEPNNVTERPCVECLRSRSTNARVCQ
jgi:hypothetical protein